ncbi:MAG: ABC transporter substrate-binding protein [Myxococcales bacterium]
MIALLLAVAVAAADRQHLGPAVPAEAHRVVTLAPSLTELVLALGARDRLVGVTRFDEDPRVHGVTRVGGCNDPEPETVLGLHPDLVLAQTGPENRGPIEALARLGIPVEAFTLGTVEQIESAIRGVGGLLGNEREGGALATRIEERRARARKAAAGQKRVRALLVFGIDPLVVAGPSGYPGQLLDDLGIDNAARDVTRPFARLSVEAAVQAAPDVLVLAGVDRPQGRPVVPGLAHVRVAPLRSQALLHPGPRLVEAIDDLEEAVRGIDPGPRVP